MGNTDYLKYTWGPAVVNKGTAANPMWRAYTIAGGGTKLYIYDMTNPTSPVKLAEQVIGTGGDARASTATAGSS